MALNRERVLRAAVEQADEIGIAGVSMRRLAQHLGVVPMALYKHVADKDELIGGMVDLVIAEFEPPDPGRPWRDDIRQRVLSARRAVRKHPWARQAIESRTRRTPAVLAYMDSLAGAFRRGGFTVDLTHHLMHALGNRIWGFSPEMFDESQGGDAPAPDPQEFARRYPHILEIAMDAMRQRPGASCDEQFEFEFALDLLLDGAERLRRRGWSSTPTAAPERS
jgi:AcrR family transcriptional regulator